jgi:mRNA guanylyltransferase
MPADGIIPDLPGDMVPSHSDQERWLRKKVAQACRVEGERYVLR